MEIAFMPVGLGNVSRPFVQGAYEDCVVNAPVENLHY